MGWRMRFKDPKKVGDKIQYDERTETLDASCERDAWQAAQKRLGVGGVVFKNQRFPRELVAVEAA